MFHIGLIYEDPRNSVDSRIRVICLHSLQCSCFGIFVKVLSRPPKGQDTLRTFVYLPLNGTAEQ